MYPYLLIVATALDGMLYAYGKFFFLGGGAFYVGSRQGEAQAGEPACCGNREGSEGFRPGGFVHGFFLLFLLVERLSLFDSCRRQLGPSIVMMME